MCGVELKSIHQTRMLFNGRRDLFCSVLGKGSGVWGLRSNLIKSQVAIDIEEQNNQLKISDGNA